MGLLFCKECFEDDEKHIVFKELYEDKYNTKFNKLENRDISEEYINNLKNNFVIDYIPSFGNVIIFYSMEDETFKYYSDKKISNQKLHSLARKYVIVFNCKILYKDDNNIKESNDNIKESNDNINNVIEPLPDVYGKIKINRKRNNIVKKINKYLHVGKLNDFKMIGCFIKNESKNVSYDEFKNNLKNKK